MKKTDPKYFLWFQFSSGFSFHATIWPKMRNWKKFGECRFFFLMGCRDANDKKNPKYFIPPERWNNFKNNCNLTFLKILNICHRVFLGEKNMTLNIGFLGDQLSSLLLYLPPFGLKWVKCLCASSGEWSGDWSGSMQ